MIIRNTQALAFDTILLQVEMVWNTTQGVAKGGVRGALAPPIIGTTKRSALFTNAQSRSASVVLDAALGPPRLAQHT